MNKKFFAGLFLLAFATCWYQQAPAKKFDLEKTLQKTKESLKQTAHEVKETLKDTVEEAKEVVTDELTEGEKGWFSLQGIKNFFSFEYNLLKNLPLIFILLIAFMIGIAASFTPCIYPMIPITMGILQSQASKSLSRNFLLSFSYVCGMATVYAILGYFAATTTLILGQWLVNPWVIGFLVLLFLYLAFSMFGFYEIYMPKFMRQGTSVKVKGSFLYSFLFGAISGTAASPCLTPALAVLLTFVAKRGNPIVGFLTLFMFALGLGVILMIIGTFSNTITHMPRAGAWMNEIKKFFGFMMIGVAAYFVQPFLSDNAGSLLYIALVVVMIGYYAKIIAPKIMNK